MLKLARGDPKNLQGRYTAHAKLESTGQIFLGVCSNNLEFIAQRLCLELEQLSRLMLIPNENSPVQIKKDEVKIDNEVHDFYKAYTWLPPKDFFSPIEGVQDDLDPIGVFPTPNTCEKAINGAIEQYISIFCAQQEEKKQS